MRPAKPIARAKGNLVSSRHFHPNRMRFVFKAPRRHGGDLLEKHGGRAPQEEGTIGSRQFGDRERLDLFQ